MDVELALDQNFPEPILSALGEYLAGIHLTPLRRIDPRLPVLDDRALCCLRSAALGVPA